MTSCGLKKVSRIKEKTTEVYSCKVNMNAQDYRKVLALKEVKQGLLQVMKCALEDQNNSVFDFYSNKVNRKSLTNKQEIEYLRMKGISYLQKQRYDLYEALRKEFRKYQSERFLKLEMHYFLLFAKVNDAKRLIRDRGDSLKGTLYLPWFYHLIGDRNKSLTFLKSYKNKSAKSYKVLVAANLDKTIKVDKKDMYTLLEKQSVEMLNAK